MKTNTLGRTFFAFWLCLAVVGAAAAADSKSARVELGNDTYAITRTAASAFHRDIDALKAEVQDDATQFCASQGKQIKVISLTTEKPHFSLGYARAKIVFKALNAGDPELTSTAEPGQGPAAVAGPAKITSTDDLYQDLVKLDDLRKKGILTDDEFQAEKKKVLARSQ